MDQQHASVRRFDHCPWLFAAEADESERAAQRERQRGLGGDSAVGERCYVAESAAVFPDRLRLGDDSYIAAHAYVTGELTTGTDCTVNPFTTVRGRVVLGDGVRIGAHTSLLGFNHAMAPDRPVFRQPLTSRGITVGDDVWIGSHVVVVDGVRIGDHCVVGAGAVVTKDLPAWSVAAGNPARVLRDRRGGGEAGSLPVEEREVERRAREAADAGPDVPGAGPEAGLDTPDAEADTPYARPNAAGAGPGTPHAGPDTTDAEADTPHAGARSPAPGRTVSLPQDRRDAQDAVRLRQGGPGPGGAHVDPLTRFADTARAQAAALLARSWDGERYVDRPGAAPTVRAHCDAVEIADLLLGEAPGQMTAGEHVERLSVLQDPATGWVPEVGEAVPVPEGDGLLGDGAALYHVLSVGYALDLLGSSFPRPVRGVQETTAEQLVARLEGLPWRDGAWGAGAWIDAWATAAHWNLRQDALRPGTLEALFGWLLTRADPWTGLWGTPSPTEGRLQVVNGYYRLTRGSFAQFGLPVPHPQRVIDAVLDHAGDPRHFGPARDNACNVLDVAHPLWLCGRQLPGHRASDIHAWADRQLTAVLPRWRPGEGFAFGPGHAPGLQGTEMWLAIVWYLADLTGRADALGYRPRGVHRPEAARQL
ncbi:acyltransferase [Streptomyces sp. NPDC004539]|uniref:acyltransferase n=1 Tax=Streptomyces sp. NPDC004539 TaxID=3154280 RepID=UPI0033B90CA4